MGNDIEVHKSVVRYVDESVGISCPALVRAVRHSKENVIDPWLSLSIVSQHVGARDSGGRQIEHRWNVPPKSMAGPGPYWEPW